MASILSSAAAHLHTGSATVKIPIVTGSTSILDSPASYQSSIRLGQLIRTWGTIQPLMNETCTKAEQLLNSIFESAGFDVRASAAESDLGCLLAIDGEDSGLLLNQGGELLDALQQILNQALGRSLPKGQRIICDANDFRAAREAELRAMAEHAARQVRATSSAFVFGPMEPGERRVIHLSLAAEDDLITESVGEGNARRLRVSLKPLAVS